jgi:hypothetical protein
MLRPILLWVVHTSNHSGNELSSPVLVSDRIRLSHRYLHSLKRHDPETAGRHSLAISSDLELSPCSLLFWSLANHQSTCICSWLLKVRLRCLNNQRRCFTPNMSMRRNRTGAFDYVIQACLWHAGSHALPGCRQYKAFNRLQSRYHALPDNCGSNCVCRHAPGCAVN